MSESKGRGGKQLPINEVALIPRIATLLVLGRPATAIARELGIGYATVKRLASTEEAKIMVRDISDSALDVAKASIKRSVAENVVLANEVLKEHLEKHRNLDAVKLVYKVAGALSEEPTGRNTDSSPIQIIMPGASAPKETVIEVLPEESEDGTIDGT